MRLTIPAISNVVLLTLVVAGIGCGDSSRATTSDQQQKPQSITQAKGEEESSDRLLPLADQREQQRQAQADGSSDGIDTDLDLDPLPAQPGTRGAGNESTNAGSQGQDLDVPYVPTPDRVVQRMLDLGQVEPGDYVMDLGSGDGRIVIQAVQRGAYGHGVDLDPQRVQEARKNAKQAGVSDRVMFLQQDIFDTDVSQASVIMMYLFPEVNLKLRPKLLKQLRPGTRVVSHSFNMDEWRADKTVEVKADKRTRTLYLWIIPADMAGQWQWTLDGRQFTWQVKQQFQELDTTLKTGDASLVAEEVELRGRRIAFATEHDGVRYLFSGRVEGNQINGTVQVRSGETRRLVDWTANKQQ